MYKYQKLFLKFSFHVFFLKKKQKHKNLWALTNQLLQKHLVFFFHICKTLDSIHICWIKTSEYYPGICILNKPQVVFIYFKIWKWIMLVTPSCLTLCNLMACSPTRFLCLWNSPGKNTGLNSCSLWQGIFLTQGLNPGLLHSRQILYHPNYQISP